MIHINEIIDSVSLKVDFSDKINILTGDSGSGKTYLMSLITYKYADTDLSISCFDYKLSLDKNKEDIIRVASNSDIVLLDNADLYMSRELFNILLKGKCTIIVSIKNLYHVPLKFAGRYKVDYTGNTISVIKKIIRG